MHLSGWYFAPFDRVYDGVTRDIERYAGQTLTGPDREWLARLVETFQQERSAWNSRPELAGYRIRWAMFRSPIMRLVAGAYLHISYDLPRAIADDWPGTGRWSPDPREYRGEAIFVALSPIFPDNLVRSVKQFQIVGWPALFAWIPGRRNLVRAGIWVDRLRAGAWSHARVLAAHPGQRALKQAAMADAMQSSLEDVTDWLSILDLGPPDSAVYSAAALTGGLATTPQVSLATHAAAFVAGGLFIGLALDIRRRAKRARREAMLIDMWGELLALYMTVAVESPEEFPAYRKTVRQSLGLAGREQSGEAG